MSTPTDRRAALEALLESSACDSDTGKTCRDNWPTDPGSWCGGCQVLALGEAWKAALLAAPPSPEPELQREVCGVRLRVRGWLTVTCDLVAGHDCPHEGDRSGERVWFDESGCGALPAGPLNPLRCDPQPPSDVAALRAQIATLEQERDEWRALTITPKGVQHYIDKAEATAAENQELKAQIATLTHERDQFQSWAKGNRDEAEKAWQRTFKLYALNATLTRERDEARADCLKASGFVITLLCERNDALVALAALKADPPPSPGGPVIAEVVAERARQDAKWGGPSHDDTHSIFDWWGFIRQRMVVRLTLDGAARDRRDLIEIAALAVAAVESLDRQTPAPIDNSEPTQDVKPLSDEERRELDDLLALLVLPPSFTAREREIAVVVARQMQAELKRKAQPSPGGTCATCRHYDGLNAWTRGRCAKHGFVVLFAIDRFGCTLHQPAPVPPQEPTP